MYTKVARRFYLVIFITSAGDFIIINLKSPLPARFLISKILLCLKIKVCVVILENSADQ